MEKVVLFGNASTARVLHYHLNRSANYEVVAFTVDANYIQSDALLDCPVVPFEAVSAIYPPESHKMMVAIGYVKVNKLRAERYAQAKKLGYELINYTSPDATVWDGLQHGDNRRIGSKTLVQPYAQLGNNVSIASGCIIGHDTVIGDHCFIASGVIIGGGVTIAPYTFIGTSATIRNRINIGRSNVIGAGAVIQQDTGDNEVYMARNAQKLPITSDKLSLTG